MIDTNRASVVKAYTFTYLTSTRMLHRFYILLIVLTIQLSALVQSFAPHSKGCVRPLSIRNDRVNTMKNEQSLPVHVLHMATDDSDELLETALRLRKEAEAMEESIRGQKVVSSNDGNNEGGPKSSAASVKTYNTLQDSVWRISYRFASDAVLKESNGKEEDDDVKVTYYSGKVDIQLTDDGYTNVMEEHNTSKSIKFEKFWGWDEENSKEDELDYVLFSADVMLPKDDPNYTKQPIRFYFQTQVLRDSRSGEISLKDGTVTLKKDVEPPGGFWGIFNGGGILAQFRYCGEFLMKPI